MHFKERDLLPDPMRYLQSHAIAFVAGAVTVLVANAYVKVDAIQRSMCFRLQSALA